MVIIIIVVVVCFSNVCTQLNTVRWQYTVDTVISI